MALESSAHAAVLLVGVSFRSAPVPILERASINQEDKEAFERHLLGASSITEAMVLSTCNRMEIYTAVTAFHPALEHIVKVFSSHTGIDPSEIESHLYVRYADAAAEHILSVGSGLDSMVVGEQQIIGQLRNAYQHSSDSGVLGSVLHELTQTALRTGKRVHSETNIDGVGASMVSFAVDHAVEILESQEFSSQPVDEPRNQAVKDSSTVLSGRCALIVGAGAMSTLASTYIGRLGIDHITILNRTMSRAENLAQHAREAGVSADVASFNSLVEEIAQADLIISATGATDYVINAEHVKQAYRQSQSVKVFCDLSMPRDIESIEDIPGAFLLNIEYLKELATEEHRDEQAARQILAEELQEYRNKVRAQAAVPTVKALRQRAADVISEELALLTRQTRDMSPEHRKEVEKTVRRVVEKLIHTPTVQVKKLTAVGESSNLNYAEALATLFNLSPGLPHAVMSTPTNPDLAVDLSYAEIPHGALSQGMMSQVQSDNKAG